MRRHHIGTLLALLLGITWASCTKEGVPDQKTSEASRPKVLVPATPPRLGDLMAPGEALSLSDTALGCEEATHSRLIVTTETPIIARCEGGDGNPLGPVYYFYTSGQCAERGQWGPGYKQVGVWQSWDESGKLTNTTVYDSSGEMIQER